MLYLRIQAMGYMYIVQLYMYYAELDNLGGT